MQHNTHLLFYPNNVFPEGAEDNNIEVSHTKLFVLTDVMGIPGVGYQHEHVLQSSKDNICVDIIHYQFTVENQHPGSGVSLWYPSHYFFLY